MIEINVTIIVLKSCDLFAPPCIRTILSQREEVVIYDDNNVNSLTECTTAGEQYDVTVWLHKYINQETLSNSCLLWNFNPFVDSIER